MDDFSSTAALLRRLRPRLPHVLPRPAHQGAAGGVMELQDLHPEVPLQALKGRESRCSCPWSSQGFRNPTRIYMHIEGNDYELRIR